MTKGRYRSVRPARISTGISILPLTSLACFRTIHTGVGVCQQFLQSPGDSGARTVRIGTVAILPAE